MVEAFPAGTLRQRIQVEKDQVQSRTLDSLMVIAVVLGAALFAFIMTFSYLGAFLDPDGNIRGMPLAMVNEDQGAVVAGQAYNFGRQAVAEVTSPASELGDRVDWTVLTTREEARASIHDDSSYAAIVIPADFSARLVQIASPGTSTPAAAEVEVLTSPASGAFAGLASQQIVTDVVSRVSETTRQRILETAAAAGLTVPAQSAVALSDPVQLKVTVEAPVGLRTGRGLAPFYFALMMTLAGYLGTVAISFGVDFRAGVRDLVVFSRRVSRPSRQLSAFRLWSAKAPLVIIMAVLAGALETWMAVGLLDMPAPDPVRLGLFATLGILAVAMPTLILLTTLGELGMIFALLFTTIFGVPSAGGVYPIEMLPAFFRFLARWLPLRYMTDGARALLFFDGRGAAGLRRALVPLGIYATGGLVLGGLVAFAIDRVAGRLTNRASIP